MSSTDLPRPLLLPDIYFSLNTICQDKARGNIYLLSHLTATLYSRLKASERPLLKYWLCHLTGCVTLGKFTPLQKGANTTYLKMSLYQLHEKMYVRARRVNIWQAMVMTMKKKNLNDLNDPSHSLRDSHHISYRLYVVSSKFKLRGSVLVVNV